MARAPPASPFPQLFLFLQNIHILQVDVAEPLGLGFNDLGKRRLGTKETLHFCDELSRLYANEADSTAIAASFAIENWAAAGFWDDLTAGFQSANVARKAADQKKLPISFWTFHSKLEQQHADHTIDELQECFEDGRIANEDEFCTTMSEMLDAVQVFWDGLDDTRKRIAPASSTRTSFPEELLDHTGTTDF